MSLEFRLFVNETCPQCRQIVRIVGTTALKGRLASHTRVSSTSWISVAIGNTAAQLVACAGSGLRSVEWRERARVTKIERQLKREASVRDDAAIAVDAFADGRDAFRFDKLLAIAIAMHERMFGPGPRGKRVCRTETLRHRDRRGSANAFYRMDVYCRFCGGLILPAIHTGAAPENLPRVKEHTLRCALQCLAGMREMQPPTTKSLIDEDRPIPD